MEYNFVPLKQKHVEAFNLAMPDPTGNVPPAVFAGGIVRAAAKAGWFEPAIKEDQVGEMEAADVNALMKRIMEEYRRVMGVSPE